MSTIPASGGDGLTSAHDIGFHYGTIIFHCLLGCVAYLARSIPFPYELLVQVPLTALIARKTAHRWPGQVSFIVFGLLGFMLLFLPPSVQTPLLVGVNLFVARLSVQLRDWVLCDEPPEKYTADLNYGLWCVGCYVAPVVFWFYVWSTPAFLYRLVVSIFWRPWFIVPGIVLAVLNRERIQSHIPAVRRYLIASLASTQRFLIWAIQRLSNQLFGSPTHHWWHHAEIDGSMSKEEQYKIQHARYCSEKWRLSTDDSGPRQIRLLRLHRRQPFGNVTASMERHAVSSLPPYDTISYCWGDDKLTHRVLVDGQYLFVTKNAYEILHARSSYFRERIMWIDGLCIDQTKYKDADGRYHDQAEKASQIKLMREIYRRSARTIVWLGFSNTSYYVIDILYRIFLAKFRYQLDDQEMHDHFGKERGSIEMQAFIDLLSHQWFTRVWVIQEVVVPRLVHVIYGGQYLHWDIVAAAIEAFSTPQTLVLLTLKQDETGEPMVPVSEEDSVSRFILSRISNMQAPPGGIEFGNQMNHLRERVHGGGETFGSNQALGGLPLHKLLFNCCWSTATQPKDKVFALLGLAVPSPPPGLEDMYNKETKDIYTNVARAILNDDYMGWALPIAGTGSFIPPRVLIADDNNSSEEQTRLPGIPSWVPDWSQAPPSNQLTEGEGNYPYAAGIVPDPPPLIVTNNRLHIKGIHAGTIKRLASHCFRLKSGASPFSFDKIRRMGDQLEEIRRMTADTEQATLWRTLVGDKSNYGIRPAPAAWEEHYKAILAVLDARRSVGDAAIAANPGAFLTGHLAAIIESNPAGNAVEFTTRLGNVCKGRRFAVMADGSIGWVPSECMEGDAVFVFLGAQVPYALKRVETRGSSGGSTEYELLGECYVHGLMGGEALRAGSRTVVEDVVLH
ncbi:heterokaryon incompatibility protein-domain-containing protein [Podospora didyma]|uniref:Heterokaryon incompatibility protein-domain-containing protein n=1 Tax=Podospora didyma TaxID=330526 RepID=A0AAE0NQ99_9PEZI|nr:heterokaryon incompatibility protein-domain-containing protein [Podospora didyma]